MSLARSQMTLHKAGALSVAAGVATFALASKAAGDGYDQHLKILDVQIALGTTGGTSGNTTIDVKKNGTSILQSPLSIAQGATTKYAKAGGAPGLVFGEGGGGEPAGVYCGPGDVLTVDVAAIPGTTSQDLSVYLSCEARLT